MALSSSAFLLAVGRGAELCPVVAELGGGVRGWGAGVGAVSPDADGKGWGLESWNQMQLTH